MRRAACAAAVLAACSAGAPEGVDKSALDEAVSRAIGRPSTCLLMARAGTGEGVYRYNTHTVCGRSLNDCAGGQRTVGDLLAATVGGGDPVMTTCVSTTDNTRTVGWAAGPVGGGTYVYAAVMEDQGPKVYPGRLMADRLADAFAAVGLK